MTLQNKLSYFISHSKKNMLFKKPVSILDFVEAIKELFSNYKIEKMSKIILVKATKDNKKFEIMLVLQDNATHSVFITSRSYLDSELKVNRDKILIKIYNVAGGKYV